MKIFVCVLLFALSFFSCKEKNEQGEIYFSSGSRKKSRIVESFWGQLQTNGNSFRKRTPKEDCHKIRKEALEVGCITQEELEDLETINAEPFCKGSEFRAFYLCDVE